MKACKWFSLLVVAFLFTFGQEVFAQEECEFIVYNESRWSIRLNRLIEGQEGDLEILMLTSSISLKPAESFQGKASSRQWFLFVAVKKGEEDYYRVGGLQLVNCRNPITGFVFTDKGLDEVYRARMKIEATK